MTTAKELIEYLKTIPEETQIRVLERYENGYSTYVKEVDLNLDLINGNIEFEDFRLNPFTKETDAHYMKTYLLFGSY